MNSCNFIEYVFHSLNEQVPQSEEFYEAFKAQVAHQQLCDLISQVQMNSSMKTNEKYLVTKILTSMAQIIKKLGQQSGLIKIRINQALFNIQRDTFCLISDIYDTYIIIEQTGKCGRDSILRQFDMQIRKLDNFSFFWHNLINLDNQLELKDIQQLKTKFEQKLDTLINQIKLEQGPKIIQKIVEVPIQNEKLLEAHELYAGLGRESNKMAALELYQQLAKSDGKAQVIMGQILLEGKLLPQDPERAFDYFYNCKDQSNTYSMFNAAQLILQGKIHKKFQGNNKLKDDDFRIYECQQAIELLKKAADMKHTESILYLGVLYEEGYKIDQQQIIEPDYHQSEKYYKMAAGNPQAYHKLGLLYKKMSQIPIYKNKADNIQDLFKQAKNLDYLPAFYDLGELLISREPQMAELTLEQGAIKGDIKCLRKLMNLKIQQLKLDQCDVQEVFEQLDQMEINNSQLKSWLEYYRGKIYKNGIGIEKNNQKAQEHFNSELELSQVMTNANKLYMWLQQIHTPTFLH
ncbi:hypothetical protein pb186bvf_009618 [Paramecium bursaria]